MERHGGMGAASVASAREREAALRRSLSLYWKPVYKSIRRAGHPIEEALDLAQDFFAHVLEGRVPARGPSTRQELLDFLKDALRDFLERRRPRPLPRGRVHRAVLSLDGADPEVEDLQAGLEPLAPDEVLNRHWAEEIFSRSA